MRIILHLFSNHRDSYLCIVYSLTEGHTITNPGLLDDEADASLIGSQTAPNLVAAVASRLCTTWGKDVYDKELQTVVPGQ